MINKKFIIFISVIVLLSITCYYFYSIEKFTSNCKEFKNVNLVFHKLNYEPTFNNRTLFNYINQDFIDKFLVNNMNSIYRPLKIRFNNIDLVEENLEENLRTHYDNFRVNYTSYDYDGRDASLRRTPGNQDAITTADKDYSALFEMIRNNEVELPEPIRKITVREEGTRQTTQSLTTQANIPVTTQSFQIQTQTPALELSDEIINVQQLSDNTDTTNTITTRASQETEAERMMRELREDEETSYIYNVVQNRNRAYDRMSPLQRFLIDENVPGVFSSLQRQQYTLERLIREGQSLYDSNTDARTRNSRFNSFFDRIDIPQVPDSQRINLRQAIINWDGRRYAPAIIDGAVLIFSEYNYQGEQIILRAGSHTQEAVRNQLPRAYLRRLDADENRTLTINVGNSDRNPKNIASMTPYLANPYDSSQPYFTAGLRINPVSGYEINNTGYNITVKRTTRQPGWICFFFRTTPSMRSRMRERLLAPYRSLWSEPIAHIRSEPYLDFTQSRFESLGFPNQFHLAAYTMITAAGSGPHVFSTRSDDGSELVIYDTVVKRWYIIVYNNGTHSERTRIGVFPLVQGRKYLILVYFFQYYGPGRLSAAIVGSHTNNISTTNFNGDHYPIGWNNPLTLTAKFIDGNIFPVTSFIVPENVIFEMYSEDNNEGTKITVPPGKYICPFKNACRPKSFNVRIPSDEDNLIAYLNDLLAIGYVRDTGTTTQPPNMPSSDSLDPINIITEVSMEFPTLPVSDVSMTFPVSRTSTRGNIGLPFELQDIGNILVDGPNKICDEMLEKFVKTDLKILKESLNKNLSQENTRVLLNLFLNAIDDSKYNDDKIHVYFLPYLPNNKKCYIVKGFNNKPLILLSLYNTINYSKNIQTYDTTTVCKNFLSEYLINKQQLIKFEQKLDELLNGERNLINTLNNQYKQKLSAIENIKSQYPNIENIIDRYNCVQKQLIEYYSKDYMKTTEVMKLNRLKHKDNYKVLLSDKIKELKAIDKVQITKLTKESIDLKKIIDESKSRVKDLSDEVENLKKRLIFLYSGRSDKKLKDRYKQTINILKTKTNKLNYLMKKLGPPIMLSKIYAILSGLSGVTEQNNTFDVLNSIKDNGIVFTQQEKDIIVRNSYENNYLNYNDEFNNYDNFIDRVNVLNSKCNIIELDEPNRAGFVKNNASEESNTIRINNNRNFIKGEAVYKKEEDTNSFSYAGYVSDIENNNLKFNYKTKKDVEEENFLFTGENTNKANCLLSTNYYYRTPPNLSLGDKIIILREIIENRTQFSYLDKEDIKYLEKLLLFLERSYFGQNYRRSQGTDLSNDKLDENYFVDKLFTREEALKILEKTIIEAYNKKGGFNINSKLSLDYRDNYKQVQEYYKDQEERNKLAPTRRVYTPPREAIPCPLKPEEQFIKPDNRTLDDYMMNPRNCDKEKYMDSFDNSFI